MLETLDTSLQSLEKSFMLSYREVLSETNNLENVLNNFKDYSSKQEIEKSKLIKIANALGLQYLYWTKGLIPIYL